MGGLVSSTAVTLAMSSRSKGDKGMERPAALAVVLAGITNTIVKGGLALALGSWGYARIVVGAFAAILAAGGLSLLAVWR